MVRRAKLSIGAPFRNRRGRHISAVSGLDANCAGDIDKLHGEAASRYWRCEVRQLAKGLTEIGMSEAEVSRQALLFTGAVMEEMQRAYAERALQQNDSNKQSI